ncbi:MAG: hypothetical protein AAF600_01940 [Bacteroidota bacterium]
MEAFVNIGLFLSYILIAICLITAVGMPLIKAFGDPQSLKKIGLGVGALIVVFIISYFISSGEEMGDKPAATVKIVGASLTTFYILAFAAILGIIYTEIKKVLE